MPVRSLTSSVLRWPDHNQVIAALQAWGQTVTQLPTPIQAIGYFGSYARGDYGVGSDLDLLIILRSPAPAPTWDFSQIPVPVEPLIYTPTAWQALQASQSRFAQTLAAEAKWIYPKPPQAAIATEDHQSFLT